MRLLRRAAGALKDRNSILAASLVHRSPLRNSDITVAVIKATSHDESRVDARNCTRVYTYIATSPASLRPFAKAISARMGKTRSWVVALKGLMLMHGVFGCKVPAVERIGRLPFDLSSFEDGHGSATKMWGYNAFVRAYYAFLDQKSAFICANFQERKARSKEISTGEEQTMIRDLVRVQNMQGLLDMLLQVQPEDPGMVKALVLEAMDCCIIEIYNIYSRICNGIAKILLRICSAGKVEATMALKILQKATMQGDDLSSYFEVCRGMGVINASECPKVQRVPPEDIQELERIITGVPEKKDHDLSASQDDKAIVVRETQIVDEEKDSNNNLKTIITADWEVFDEDSMKVLGETSSGVGRRTAPGNPFASPYLISPDHPHATCQELPDLISFL